MTDQVDRLTEALTDRYGIEQEIGVGGMATVYLATDLKHDRRVAVKVLRPDLAALLGVDRFLQEIKTTASLHQVRELEDHTLENSGQLAVSTAWAHAGLGNVDAAITWLERAIVSRNSFVVSLPSFCWWDPLRSDPLFKAILRRLCFPE